MAEPAHFHGHRERLRERFNQAGPEALHDYELLELLLCQALPRGDVKPLAKALLARFGNLAAVLGADASMLQEMAGIGPKAAFMLKLMHAFSVRTLKASVMGRPVIGSWDALLDYCRASMAHSRIEQFRVLYLDVKNALIADEVHQEGTVNHVPLYPREVIKRALSHGASALILVHNHPSGDPTPSAADIQMTNDVSDAGQKLGIAVHDHLIIGGSRHSSFRALGLLRSAS